MRIKNWDQFQHYKTGRGAPPWIKLYRDLLNDPAWFELPPDAAKFLISCWLIAAENDGNLPDSKTLAFRYRVASKEIDKLLSLCKDWIILDDSMLLADCYQVAIPETETETETDKIICPKPVRTQYTESFEKFWSAYPTDKNMSKKDAFTVWKRLSVENQDKAIRSLDGFKAYCRANPDYRPKHADGFLKGERWEGYLASDGRAVVRKSPNEMTPEEIEVWLAEQEKERANV